VASDKGSERAAIVSLRNQVVALRCFQFVRVHEIRMQSIGSHRYTGKERMVFQYIERIPAHMRDLQIRTRRRNAIDFACDPPETWCYFVFASALRHQLHPDTDAEEGLATFSYAMLQRIDHTGNFVEPAAAIGECANAGKHNPFGARDRIRIAGDGDRLLEAAFARRAFEGLCSRMQVARPVVDDSNAHR